MRKYCHYVLILILFFTLHNVIFAESESTVIVQRFALIVGSNYGGSGLAVLKYAVEDAKVISEIFSEIGGVREENKICLYNPGYESIKQSFMELKNTIELSRDKAERTEIVFYYSGHAEASSRSLLLRNNERYEFRELNDDIKSVSCDVNIAIIDSCASGAFIRDKGGKIISPFIINSANKTKGYAFITSCTDKEQSYESDKIKSSFFTYALKAGLRGAADADGNGNVSLHEIYDYAFNETIQQTQIEATGLQHPSYSINLIGTGNIILTDVQENTSRIIFPENITGTIFIHENLGNLILEFHKQNDRKTEISLASGEYLIHIRTNEVVYKTKIKLYFRDTIEIISLNRMDKKIKIENGNKGVARNPPSFSLGLFAGPSLPVLDPILDIGIISWLNFETNFQFDFLTLSIGLLSGFNNTHSNEKINSDYSISTYPFMLSLALSKNVSTFNFFTQVAAGLSLNSQHISSSHKTLLGVKPMFTASGGFSIPVVKYMSMGFYTKLVIIIFDDFEYYSINPGLIINFLN